MNLKPTATLRRKLSPENYRFKVLRSFLIMPDGTRLDSTIFMPVRKQKGEKFPVLLEVLPYRKDDTFFLMDYPAYAYFARHGFITVKVDIRGTGGSDGMLPEREYSDQEIFDTVEVIKQLAKLPKANGKVGMFGVSWSGFNSIQVAMKNPPELKAILAMHASDDLYHDDLHYIDGVLHLDPYHLYINHENGLPRTPQYRLDQAYFKNRFEAKPWIFTYLNHQTDGKFWSEKSLASDYQSLKVPAYLIGGLMDGYRDTVVRALSHCSAPIKAEIGPFDHSCPDGDIGPQHDWQDEAIRWFEHYLKGYKNGIEEEMATPARLSVFVRSGQVADPSVKKIGGDWQSVDWPLKSQDRTAYYPSQNGGLNSKQDAEPCKLYLPYLPSAGMAAGIWWGDTTGDMSEDDGRSLVFDSEPLAVEKTIVGLPEVRLEVSANAQRANWSVRLEDVHPDGRVSLVTGALINGRHLESRSKPEDLTVDKVYQLKLKLHFTTWTFQPGHRIRLAISNAQFPMVWPSPYKMASMLNTGRESTTCMLLPEMTEPGVKLAAFEEVKDKPESDQGEYLEFSSSKPDFSKYAVKNMLTGAASYHHNSNSAYRIKQREFKVESSNIWTISDADPSRASYDGKMSTTIKSRQRSISLVTKIQVKSTRVLFRVKVVRSLYKNGKLVRNKTWTESIPRINS